MKCYIENIFRKNDILDLVKVGSFSFFSFYFYRVVLTISIFSFLYSCSSSPVAEYPYKALVLHFDKENSTLGSSRYRLSVKDLVGLKSLSSLEGDYFKIKEGGVIEVEIKDNSESISSFGKGSDPYIRYKLKDSVIIPKDYKSLMLLSIYYQFTQIFSYLKEYTGIEPASMVQTIDSKKMTVWYEPTITNKKSDNDSNSSTMKLNAMYFPGLKQFILCQRSNLERVPISSNLSVIAHEFGHALFEHIFFHDEEEPSRYQQSEAISGMNEGFADYMSYIYTGVSNILGSSFLLNKEYDQRDFVASTFTFDDYQAHCTGGYYCFGTLLARSFYQTMKSSGYEDKQYEFLQKIIDALSKAKATFESSQFYSDVYDSSADKFPSEIKVISLFLYSVLKNFDSSFKDNLCTSFRKNFGSNIVSKTYFSGECDSVLNVVDPTDVRYIDIDINEFEDSFIYFRR